MSRRGLFAPFAAVAVAAFVAASLTSVGAGQTPANTVAADGDNIGGVVTGARGPEAGVWVIAETRDTPTRLIKIVVTDDQGRYLVPGLPKGSYDVWVRGYGLVDSAKMRAKPGMTLDLAAVPAPNAAAAAHYYPAIYWYTLMKIPPASEFGGKGAIPEKITQNDWQGRLALERMTRELRTVRTPTPADLNIGAAGQITFTDFAGNTIVYRQTGNTIERSQNAGAFQPLADNVSTTSPLSFSYLRSDGVTPESGGVSANVYYLTVSFTVSSANASATYRGAVKPTSF